MTIMFTAFTGKARITRCFCKGELVEKDDQKFADLFARFDGVDESLIRRLILFSVVAVEKSCGESVPFMEYKGDRDILKTWAKKMAKKSALGKYILDHTKPPKLN